MPVVTRHSRWAVGLIPVILVLTGSGLVFYKARVLGYGFRKTAPVVSYYLETVMEFEGHGSGVAVGMSLPEALPDQHVSGESFNSGDLQFRVVSHPGDRRGLWRAGAVKGKRRIGYKGTILTMPRKYHIAAGLPTRQDLPDGVLKYLLPDSMVQSDSPLIGALADSLGLSPDSTFLRNCRVMFDFVTHGMKYVRYSGTTDALTAYQLGEASCGGKSRLMAALSRYLGLPARLIGGKILRPGRSTATHIWLEVYGSGHWIPFCPTNDYFAEIPGHYLTLYYGEAPFLTHTRDINFHFYFNVKKRLAIPQVTATSGSNQDFTGLSFWNSFRRAAISLELLRIILLLPIGALIIVIGRNVIGLETFGTFMPALIAVGFRETGLLNGLILFAVILAFGTGIRALLDRLQLLHTPRLAIILSVVVVSSLGMTTLGTALGLADLARVALFPLVILTLTIERFSIMTDESGLGKGLQTAFVTMVVASAAYAVMSWRLLQALIVTYPELLLLVVALLIHLGRYTGLRVLELVRFRELLVREETT